MWFVVYYSTEHFQHSIGLGLVSGLGLVGTQVVFLWLKKIAVGEMMTAIWNSLPDYVVAVDCVNTFKTRLDKYWKDQDVMYDWTSEITGTEDRSEYILEST